MKQPGGKKTEHAPFCQVERAVNLFDNGKFIIAGEI